MKITEELIHELLGVRYGLCRKMVCWCAIDARSPCTSTQDQVQTIHKIPNSRIVELLVSLIVSQRMAVPEGATDEVVAKINAEIKRRKWFSAQERAVAVAKAEAHIVWMNELDEQAAHEIEDRYQVAVREDRVLDFSHMEEKHTEPAASTILDLLKQGGSHG